MKTDRLDIREIAEADLPALGALYQHLIPGDDAPAPAEAAEILRRFRAYPGSAILGGWRYARLVASCTLVVVPNLTRGGTAYGLVENVVTHSAHRGQGYGRAMLDRATERAWAAGCYKLMLMTGSRHPATLAFYEASGFEQSKTGFQKRRIPKRPEP
ncbi:MAG: GNAT family N-acetyltransferase [Pseudomonadota bacterium]